MSCAAIIGAVIGMQPPPPDDDHDRRRDPPKPTPPPPPSGADVVRGLVKDVKDAVPDTEDSLQP